MLTSLIDEIPLTWSGGHVSRRMVEALHTLRLLPIGGSSGYGSTWPAHVYEFEDLIAQAEQGELERTLRQQNRVKLLPGLQEISRMESVITWPMQYLRQSAELQRAVTWVAFAYSLDRDTAWIARKFGGVPDTWRQNHDRGCNIIAISLRTSRVGVF